LIARFPAPAPLVLALAAVSSAAAAAPDCAALSALKLPRAQIHAATAMAAGDRLALWPGGAPQPMPLAFCRVRGLATPVPGSAIGFEVWLPEAQAWNGKFMQAGNGGTAGAVPLGSLLDALQRGYAAAATDGGHVWPDGLDYGWAQNRAPGVVDFGWRAVQATTQAARAIVAAGLRRTPARSYFVGCSNGGRDAMMVAQRFPQAFDGIVAGAPALAWVDLMTAQARAQRELAQAPGALPVAKLPAIQAAALAACGQGRPYVADPPTCRFDPAVMACSGAETDSCLTPRQIEQVRLVYRGFVDAGSGRLVPGLSPGAEAEPGNWDFWVLRAPTNPMGAPLAAGTLPTSIGESFYRHLVREDASFTLAEFRDADEVQARRRWSADLDATDPDLRKLRQRGTKLLHYHGWADAAISPRMSLDYHQAVQQRLGDTAAFYRLFMVPGMNHCGGGSGPWQADWLHALEAWVEEGRAPAQITARHPGRGDTQTLLPQGLR
jgi:Tannase and feruloyl esterase